MKYVIYIVIILLSLVSAVIAYNVSSPAPEQTIVVQENKTAEINVKTVDVLVARSDIPVGTVIDSAMIARQPWPENLVLDNFVVKGAGGEDNIIGKVARSPIQAQEPFMKSKLANPNDSSFLASNLAVEMRAITIATDSISGVAGYVFPGDKVDVLFTHEGFTENGQSTGRPQITEVIAPNVKVLAINGRESEISLKLASTAPSSVTLEVSEKMAKILRLAEKNGTLSLSLRSYRDDSKTVNSAVDIRDVTTGAGKSMAIVRGPGAKGGKIETEFTNGAGSSNAAQESNLNVPNGAVMPSANEVNVINKTNSK